jgi:large subunit ribosomal protein L19
VAARGDVRRAKLYYLRERVGRGARVRERRWTGAEQAYVAGAMPPDDVARAGEEELAEAVEGEAAAAEGEAASAEAASAEPADESAADEPDEGTGEQSTA